MRVDYLEIALRGNLILRDQEPVLQVSGSEQEFELAAGRVDGWNGRFPVVLKTLAKRYGTDGKKPILLVITSLETAEKK
jgi:hypothetical protein